MSRWRSVWLVARREIIERGRSRGFILSVFLTTALVIGSFIVPTILFGGDEVTKIGLVDPAPAGLPAALEATAAAAQHEIEVVSFADRASAEGGLESEEIAVAVAVPDDLSGPGETIYQEARDPLLDSIISSAVIGLRVDAVLTDSNVDQAALAAAQAPPATTELDPETDADQAQFFMANIGTILILVSIFSFGFTVLTGVVEEKQSRVVEVVLATVRPSDLLMGKVLGIGVLGLFQLAVFVLAGGVAALATDRLVLPSTTPAALLLLVVWFILGYTLYSTTLGFLGALASRMEEASNASTPVTMIATISYFVAIFAVADDPNGTVATVATFLPPSAPMVVPLRAAFDAIAPWEIGLSIVVTLAAICGLFLIGGRVYAGAALQTTGRMKLRDAWRSAGR
jgi:ABC-2 type transport system permease protein